MQEIWFGSRNEVLNGLMVVDGKYRGELRTKNSLAMNFPFCLVVKLNGIDALREYYEDPIHSEIRRELLCFCEPKLRNLYSIVDAAGKLSDDETAVVFDAIEAAAATVLLRADFTVESPPKGLLEASPVDFQLPNNQYRRLR